MRRPSPRELSLVARALLTVAAVRVALWARGAGAVRRRIAARRVAGSAGLGDMREIAWSVDVASRFVPGATCLTRALSGQALLARRGAASTVLVSLSPGDGSRPSPHAWLLCNDTILLGGRSADFQNHRGLVAFRTDGGVERAPQARERSA
ncbi:lasso peptide biosynthesis B2 protein [Salinarimonas rosea]|uniref:lasso peptide biosynthesis B2 protein n=1 Tax=Salinarimonas rosea TaxID=552063 RepID=UPI000427DC52|nr:lasso peptide biosynthesis B2 protein [Salinarimonas rosea]